MRALLRVRETRHPVMYELNVRSWLARLTKRYGRRVQLGDVPREEIEPIVATGTDLVWLMGVWRTGPAGRLVSRTLTGLATSPGMLLLHDGQLDGARVRTPVELGRRPEEAPNPELRRY